MSRAAKRKPAKRKNHSRDVQTSVPAGLWKKLHGGVDITDPAPPPTAAETLTIRQSTHGDFSENARVMQGLRRELRSAGNWNLGLLQDARQLHPNILSDVAAEAIEMIVVKLGRIVTGDPNHADSWLDIEGYARLARERLT